MASSDADLAAHLSTLPHIVRCFIDKKKDHCAIDSNGTLWHGNTTPRQIFMSQGMFDDGDENGYRRTGLNFSLPSASTSAIGWPISSHLASRPQNLALTYSTLMVPHGQTPQQIHTVPAFQSVNSGRMVQYAQVASQFHNVPRIQPVSSGRMVLGARRAPQVPNGPGIQPVSSGHMSTRGRMVPHAWLPPQLLTAPSSESASSGQLVQYARPALQFLSVPKIQPVSSSRMVPHARCAPQLATIPEAETKKFFPFTRLPLEIQVIIIKVAIRSDNNFVITPRGRIECPDIQPQILLVFGAIHKAYPGLLYSRNTFECRTTDGVQRITSKRDLVAKYTKFLDLHFDIICQSRWRELKDLENLKGLCIRAVEEWRSRFQPNIQSSASSSRESQIEASVRRALASSGSRSKGAARFSPSYGAVQHVMVEKGVKVTFAATYWDHGSMPKRFETVFEIKLRGDGVAYGLEMVADRQF